MKLSLIIGPLATINMLMNSWYVYSNNGVWKQMHRGHQQTQHHTKQYIYDNYAIAREKQKKEGSRASCCWKSIEVALEYNARSVQILNELFFFCCCCCGFSWTVQCPAMVKIYYINILIRNFDEKRCAWLPSARNGNDAAHIQEISHQWGGVNWMNDAS